MMGDLLLGAPTMGTHGAIGAFVDDVSAVTFIDAFDASRDNGSRIQLVTNRADVNSCYIQLLKRVDGEFILLGEFALATPPQEFNLPLADGWLPIDARYDAVYWKTQESIVNISLGLKSDHTVTNGETIATLPSGFRPKKSLKIPITAVNQNELLVHGYVDINRSDGTIQIYKIADQIRELCFPTTNFLANG